MTQMTHNILEALPVLFSVAFLTILMYLYFTNPRVRGAVKAVLPFLPFLFSALAKRTDDKPNVFDGHDLFILLSDLSTDLRKVISDPANTSFDDVEVEVFQMVEKELEKYRKAGVANVPSLSSDSVREQVKIAFETVRQLMASEGTDEHQDSSGNNSQA